MKRKNCLDCNNHSSREFRCLIDHPNYKNKQTADLNECFVKNKLAISLDKMDNLLDRMNEILNKKMANSR